MEHLHWLAWLYLIVDLAIRIGLAIRVIMRRLNVGVSLAWLIIILVFPVAGALIYLMFGELRLGRRRAELAKKFEPNVRHWFGELRSHARFDWERQPRDVQSLGRLVEAATGVTPLCGNSLELLEGFDAVIDRLIADIDSARETCDMEFYIWSAGGRTEEVAAALLRAAKRNVKCRLLLDDVGSRSFLRSPKCEELRKEGVRLQGAMHANVLRMLLVRFDLRLHRKIAVIDNRLAYTGSLNIADPRFFKQDSGVGEWVDAMVRITGPAVGPLAMTFSRDWAEETGETLVAPTIEKLNAVASADAATVQVIPSGPDMPTDTIERIVLMAIYGAQREIVLTTPYFVPDEPFLSALLSAAERGVSVTLIVPARVDSVLVRLASRAFQSDLLAAGARVMLFKGGLLHTKSIAIDGEISLFGSLNLDPRSLHLNFEITLGVYDKIFTSELRGLQESYIKKSSSLDLATWNRRGKGRRLLENSARLLGPLI